MVYFEREGGRDESNSLATEGTAVTAVPFLSSASCAGVRCPDLVRRTWLRRDVRCADWDDSNGHGAVHGNGVARPVGLHAVRQRRHYFGTLLNVFLSFLPRRTRRVTGGVDVLHQRTTLLRAHAC